ncbi:MAG TPA: divergent polysaccharide deacetylase family protein [Alphaproteobacteria bacterium]
MNENAPSPETETEQADATTPVAKKNIMQSLGWGLWSVLLLLTIIGLIVAGLSTPQQIDPTLQATQSVPREVAVPKPAAPPPKPPEPKPEPVPMTPVISPLQDDTQPQEETQIRIGPQTLINYTPLPAEKPVQVAAAIPAKKPEPTPVTAPSVPSETRATLPHFAKPVIAIVIDDMGLDRRHTTQITALAAPITLAFMPYAEQLDTQTKQAWTAGHELIVHMPMEPEDLAHNNPGPNALLLKNGTDENVRRLDHNLASFQGYMGINNHMGSAFTMSRAAVTPVLEDIKKRGLWFLDSKTDARSVASTVADEIGLPYASRDIFLDNVNSKQAVLAQLKQVEQVARKKGYAIAIGHPKEGTVTALQEWLPQIQQRNFALVPLSTIIHARFPKAAVPRYARNGEFNVAEKSGEQKSN